MGPLRLNAPLFRIRLTGRSGFQLAMVRAHRRASALSPMPGNSRRSSIAADNSPPRSNAARIRAASASVTTNIPGAWGSAPKTGVQHREDHAWRGLDATLTHLDEDVWPDPRS